MSPLVGNWTEIAKLCSQETPDGLRLTVADIVRFVNSAFGRERINAMEKLQNMMNNYANKLEDLVAERTLALVREQTSCDELLKEMLPA